MNVSQLYDALIAALPVLLTILAYSLIGGLGTAIEKWGERKGSKFLIDLGQRLEAIGTDGPKVAHGSRITKLERELKAADTSLPEAVGLAKREGIKRSLRPEPGDEISVDLPGIPPLASAPEFKGNDEPTPRRIKK